jgi:D-beta-D-heptose 7-phosphate kinase/D-beta-D-heptose 1-phosphate adenosyltransferase
VITEATKLGIHVLVDPKSKNFSHYAGATTICPNLAELSLATGEDAADVDALLGHGQRFVSDYRLQYLTVTMGEKGIVVLWPEGRYHAAAMARQVFDVSGAGDIVIATLAICAPNGVNLRLAAELANVTAGIVIGNIGTVPVTQEELLAELGAAAVVKLYLQKTPALSQLLERIAAWRAAGDRIVFTNGCFDLLHVGHVTLLERYKQFGERLIIGINSDASVARLKGPSRPIISETERMQLVCVAFSFCWWTYGRLPASLEEPQKARRDLPSEREGRGKKEGQGMLLAGGFEGGKGMAGAIDNAQEIPEGVFRDGPTSGAKSAA